MADKNTSSSSADHRSHWETIRDKRRQIISVREEIEQRQNWLSALVRSVGNFLSHPLFFVSLLLAHALWVVLNLPLWPWRAWDPYPYTFLATVASVEAPFIALLVLMSEQRTARIDELREETELQVSLHIERQISLTLRLLQELQEKLQVETKEDPDLLEHMRQALDPHALLEHLREELREAEGGSESTSP